MYGHVEGLEWSGGEEGCCLAGETLNAVTFRGTVVAAVVGALVLLGGCICLAGGGGCANLLWKVRWVGNLVVGTFADVVVVGITVMGPERAAFYWWLVEAGRRVAPFAGRSVALAHVDYRVA